MRVNVGDDMAHVCVVSQTCFPRVHTRRDRQQAIDLSSFILRPTRGAARSPTRVRRRILEITTETTFIPYSIQLCLMNGGFCAAPDASEVGNSELFLCFVFRFYFVARYMSAVAKPLGVQSITILLARHCLGLQLHPPLSRLSTVVRLHSRERVEGCANPSLEYRLVSCRATAGVGSRGGDEPTIIHIIVLTVPRRYYGGNGIHSVGVAQVFR